MLGRQDLIFVKSVLFHLKKMQIYKFKIITISEQFKIWVQSKFMIFFVYKVMELIMN